MPGESTRKSYNSSAISEDFADVINWWLADPNVHQDGPWRLQELQDPELRKLGPVDQPDYGRRYAIFYNQVRVGIEVAPYLDYSPKNPCVRTHIELDWVRLLAAGTIRSFFSTSLRMSASSIQER
jgi:hypothetical protein